MTGRTRALRWVRQAVMIGLVVGASRAAVAEADVAAVPRYQLKPGQELTYKAEYRSEHNDPVTNYKVDWKVWVLAPDTEGAWPLILQCSMSSALGASSGRPAENARDILIWQCRVFDDGRLEGADTMGTVRDPFRLFPRLPADNQAMEQGWSSTGAPKDQTVFHYRLASKPGPDDTKLTFVVNTESPIDKVYEMEHSIRQTFDTERHLVAQVETEDSSAYPRNNQTRGTIELVSVEDHGAEWAAQLSRDAKAYSRAIADYEALARRAARDAEQCQALVDQAKAALKECRQAVEAAVFQEAIDKKLTQLERSSKYYGDEAAERAKLVGKPAADWEAKDLAGKSHRLADYKGKVVLLDFWYRGCGWCMFAMPQVSRLAQTFEGKPVAVLAMSIDEDPKDSQVVADAMHLRYPILQAKDVPSKYGVHGYPTLIVIDQAGKVHDIHVGYSPTLFDKLAEQVRSLLKEEKTSD